MYLKRASETYSSTTTTQPNSPVISEVNVGPYEFIGAFFKSTVDTTIILQVKRGVEWFNYDEIEIKAGKYEFLNIWSAPFTRIRFISTNPSTVDWQMFFKT